MKGPSKHLSWKELACKDGTPYPKEFIKDGRVYELAIMFEDIRELCGGNPILVVSGYRTPTWNRKVGGAKNSQHIQGRALDLKHTIMNRILFHKTISDHIDELGIRGLGNYPLFIHVDIRPTKKVARWNSILLKDADV